MKFEQLPPQILSATLTHDIENKPVHNVVEHESVLPSQKHDLNWFQKQPNVHSYQG